jgi:dolichyl-phosphate beta-glucosyltransferase
VTDHTVTGRAVTAVGGGPLGLVVPVYDEAARVGEFTGVLAEHARTLPSGSEVLFVDDGSTDGTAEAIESILARHRGAPASVLRRPHRGKGAAVSAGLQALGQPHLGFCDLDLSTPLDQLDLVVEAARRAPLLAIGSRDLAGSRLVRPESPVREALGRTYNRLLQATVTPGVVDTQCGAKAAPLEVWRAVLAHCREEGFAWDAEVIAVARALGIEVLEVPVAWSHDDRSKVNVVRDGAAMVRATPRLWRSARRARSAAAPRVPAPDATVPAARGTREVFDDANAEALMAADGAHWWFRSKAALVATALRRTAPVGGEPGRGWLLDVGAGSGGVTALLGWAPQHVVVVEGHEALVRRARQQHGFAGARADVAQVPVADGAASVVCLLDVIEHLEDPVAALREAGRLLGDDGRLVVNVPAHGWLWSAADEALGHLRRYTRRSLRAELERAGFEVVTCSHVFSWLVPAAWVSRRVVRPGTADLGLDRTSPVLDRVAMVLTALERKALTRVSSPIGTSVLAVARPRPAGRAGTGSGDRR